MKSFQRILSNLSLFLLVMLLFLVLFKDRITLPPILQSAGRTHPLILHLPIGLIILTFIFWISKKNFEQTGFQKMFLLLLHITAFMAALTALMGLFLSTEGGYEENILSKHRFLGVAIALLAYAILVIYRIFPERKKLFGVILFLCLSALIAGSHFGSILTHGEGYVWEPMKDNGAEEPITDSSTFFTAAIRPILKSKCFSCHNERKSKGDLVMTTEEKLLKGGKNGPVWESGDALNSHIIQNIQRPLDHKKHMPPKGKPQLTGEETALLFSWIQQGADMNRRVKDYSETDTLRILAAAFIRFGEEETQEKQYPFTYASTSLVRELNNPFCALIPLSQFSPALQARFFIREKYDRENLRELLKVKKQLTELDLGNMPADDEDMKTVSQFINLEKLNLNHTKISNRGLAELTTLKKLVSLSLAGTAVDKQAAPVFTALDSLKEVFIWDSGISVGEADSLHKAHRQIVFNTGYHADENEILPLTPPVVTNEKFILTPGEKIELKHQIPGVIIRYTHDGSDPDSVHSDIYSDPINADGFTMIKARAVKPGWYSSPVAYFSFFRKGLIPESGELVNQPNESYKGEGVKTLIDSKQGKAENFRDKAWLGYREKTFDAVFDFENKPIVNSISISYAIGVQSYIMPPVEIEIRGGNQKGKLTLLKKVFPEPLTKEALNAVRAEGLRIDLPGTSYKYYEVIAKNITKLPSWHPGKGDRGWVFIDEIFFN